ncbi:MAG: translation elongation factor Ts [Gammaproteobacteria bacterium]|nr:translation elongation factor Ts [Gammaproteobacteria bacterium]MCD8525212.1 translation elongation factor Ts [Gammaproteobacteria bacterium]MCD8542394.1 translation elongation factor Ts [Gammaproteobacteria bacterium]
MSVVISASLVKELRERTGAAMMDCKHALVAANGDIDAAIEAMRVSGQAKAVKKAGRVAAEGVVVIRHQGNTGVMLEINCETDFVARDVSFLDFTAKVADLALAREVHTVEALLETAFDSGETVENVRQVLVTKIGENVQLRRLALLNASGTLGAYSHGSKIGVLISITGSNDVLAKDLAMHIAAMKPIVVSPEQVPADVVEAERKIQVEQALESGKPKELIDKMIDGRMRKFLSEMSLVGQPFVKDPSVIVGNLLKQNQMDVIEFLRFEAGEGIEKKVDNFAEEVMAQVKGNG